MSDLRFISKAGRIVEGSTVCTRFFELAVAAGGKLDYASAVWHDAMHGDPLARELIEDMCDIRIVSSDAGFGFLE